MEETLVEVTSQMMEAAFIVAAVMQLVKDCPAKEYIDGWLPHFSLVISVAVCYAMGIDNMLFSSVVVSFTSNGGYDLLKGKNKNRIRDTPIPMEPPSL